MLNFNLIIDDVCGVAKSAPGISKTASRNHYEWTLANGLRAGDRVRLKDGREGALTAVFPGCRGDGDWCGIFLDDGSEENIRPDHVASVFGKSAADPARVTDSVHPGRSVRYVVEFRGHGTDHMSAKMTKDTNGPDGDEAAVAGHERSAKLLQALVEFEDNATGPDDEHGPVL